LIAHELHDEFGQSVTAIRSLAQAIAAQGGVRDPATGDVARLISDEAARLYDAMHGLIPRLAPLSLDTLAWPRRSRLGSRLAAAPSSIALSLHLELSIELGPSIALAVYRVVQEGLINALRHARASRVDIAVRCDARRILATVTTTASDFRPIGPAPVISACADWRSGCGSSAALRYQRP